MPTKGIWNRRLITTVFHTCSVLYKVWNFYPIGTWPETGWSTARPPGRAWRRQDWRGDGRTCWSWDSSSGPWPSWAAAPCGWAGCPQRPSSGSCPRGSCPRSAGSPHVWTETQRVACTCPWILGHFQTLLVNTVVHCPQPALRRRERDCLADFPAFILADFPVPHFASFCSTLEAILSMSMLLYFPLNLAQYTLGIFLPLKGEWVWSRSLNSLRRDSPDSKKKTAPNDNMHFAQIFWKNYKEQYLQ